jgi:hypothetical protein
MLYIKKPFKYNFKLIRGAEEISGPELEIVKPELKNIEKPLQINSIEEVLAVIQDLQPSLLFIMRKGPEYNFKQIDADLLQTINEVISNIRSIITLGEGNRVSDKNMTLLAEAGKELLKKIPVNSKDYLLLAVAINLISNLNNIVSFE